jgi:plasmid stability protein
MKAAMKRATVYFDPKIHKALRIKAAATDRSMSEIVNEAVRVALTEDAEDLEAFEKRASEPNLLFEEVLQDLKNRGQI